MAAWLTVGALREQLAVFDADDLVLAYVEGHDDYANVTEAYDYAKVADEAQARCIINVTLDYDTRQW